MLHRLRARRNLGRAGGGQALAALALGLILTAAPAGAGETGESGLALPRFVSLKASEVNLRAGPSMDHRVLWTYVKPGLPVEVIAEFDHWRQIRDIDGTEGWVHKSLLMGDRHVLVRGGGAELRQRPIPEGRLTARLSAGVLARLERCRDAHCKISVGDHVGWVPRAQLFGIYPEEAVD